ncbi:hypothetical protein LCGC14_0552220 [marine sediment metagenome]|uniref:Uncharacterized protein n=1 Tax=marine sediment metagenome TaxID=412755 RepID=A0A0F9RUJ3_9ZZZZ
MRSASWIVTMICAMGLGYWRGHVNGYERGTTVGTRAMAKMCLVAMHQIKTMPEPHKRWNSWVDYLDAHR